jgi:hypothetical protein
MIKTAQVAITVTFLTSVREILGSNLSQSIGCPDRIFVVFCTPFTQMPGWYRAYATAASFQILSIHHHFINLQLDACLAIDTVVK